MTGWEVYKRLPNFFCACRYSSFIPYGTVRNNLIMDKTDFTTMPTNKNALIRYRTIDRCLRNRYRRWTLNDLVDACSDALYEMEGICGVSTRTVQADIQMMRSDKLGYYAPIEVYDNKYYRYSDPDYSIVNNPLTVDDYDLLVKALEIIEEYRMDGDIEKLDEVLIQVKDKLGNLLKVI